MKKKKVVDVVADVLDAFLKQHSLELVDVEFVKEGPFRYLRVMIDKDGGVGLDDCSLVSKYLNKKLDEMDPIEEHYFLEVTSPGIERQLKKLEDFTKFAGKTVVANLFNPVNGSKVIKGVLKGMKDNKVTIHVDTHGDVEIPRDKISMIKLFIDFDEVGDLDDIPGLDEPEVKEDDQK